MTKSKTGLTMKYFVLSPTKNDDYGYASREALRTYAYRIRAYNGKLSLDLEEWIQNIEDRLVGIKNDR